MKIALILLCGGKGTRFAKSTTIQKPLIPVFGKSQLFWSTKGAVLSYDPDFVIFASRSEIEKQISAEVNSFSFLPRHEVLDIGISTEGPAHTVELAVAKTMFDLQDTRIIVVDNDCFNFILKHKEDLNFPFVSTTTSSNPAHCYLEVSPIGSVLAFYEKSQVGKIAVSGNYAFQSATQFLDALSRARKYSVENQELYLSSVMVELIQQNEVQVIQASKYFSLGTPEEITNVSTELLNYD